MTRLADAIKDDHRELEEAYNKILSAKTSDEKTRWQNQFTWELARHSIGEELIVYPLMEKNLPNGKAMADKDRKEHQTVFPLSPLPSLHLNMSVGVNRNRSKNTSTNSRASLPRTPSLSPRLSPSGLI
jgi:hypothetical protein